MSSRRCCASIWIVSAGRRDDQLGPPDGGAPTSADDPAMTIRLIACAAPGRSTGDLDGGRGWQSWEAAGANGDDAAIVAPPRPATP